MEARELNIVTGAFSYTGKYIACWLLSVEKEVRTLTGRPDYQNPFGNRVRAFPFNFDNLSLLKTSGRDCQEGKYELQSIARPR